MTWIGLIVFYSFDSFVCLYILKFVISVFGYETKRKFGASNVIDLFSCRGEKAFCSSECRYQQILLEEGMDKLEPDDDYGTCS